MTKSRRSPAASGKAAHAFGMAHGGNIIEIRVGDREAFAASLGPHKHSGGM
jgi:hypothetical protein